MDAGDGPLRGRDREVALFDALSVQDGAGRVVTIAGEAGIGKSSLWAYAVDAQRRAGRRTLATTCPEVEAEMPYAGLADLVGDLLDEHAGLLPPVQRRAMERALLRCDDVGPVDARTVATGVLTLLRAGAARDPLVLAIDDVQWLDVETDRCLAFALRRLDRTGPLVLLTRREHSPLDGGSGEDRAGSVAAVTAPRGETVRLGPLDPSAARSMIHDRYGVTASWDEVRALVAETGGNPLWLTEFARARRHPRPGADRDALPPSLAALVHDRLDRLDPGVVAVATVVAMLGRPHLVTVERAVLADDELDGDDLEGLLDEAVTAGLVVLAGERLLPAHAVIGAALLTALPPFRRRRLHRHVADLADSPEERAHHLLAARLVPTVGIGDPDGTAESDERTLLAALDDAVRSTEKRGATVQAARFAERALEVARSCRPDEVARRIVLAADLHARTGEFGRARTLLDGLDLTELDDALFERGALVFNDAVMRTEGRAAMHAHLRSLETAARGGERGDGPDRRRVAVAAIASDRQMGLPDRLETAEKAVVDIDPAVASTVLQLRALAHLLSARLDAGLAAVDVLERMQRLTPPMPSSATLLVDTAIGFDGLIAYTSDDLERSATAFRAARRQRLEVGDDYGAAGAANGLAMTLYAAGRLPEADAALDLVDESLRRTFPEMSVRVSIRAMIRMAGGDLDGAEELVADAEDIDDVEWVHGTGLDHLRGLLAAERGDHALAVRLLSRFVETCTELEVVDPVMRLSVDLDLAEAHLQLGDLERAAEVADHLGRIADLGGRSSTRGQELRIRAEIALRRDPGTASSDAALVEEALAMVREAVARHAAGQRPVEHGRSLAVLARAHRRLGHHDIAHDLEERARDVFHLAGHHARAERVGAGDPRSGGRSSLLTPSEWDVAEIVLAGSTNREVAGRLGLSVRTVENHLHSVYRKLGIRSRDDLRAALERA